MWNLIIKGYIMKEIIIDKEWIKQSQLKSKEMGTLNNSITKGDGNLSGFIGEMMALSCLPEAKLLNTYDFDIIYKDNKLDVKTKRTKVAPREYYDCSVAAFNTKQKCSHYVFTRILNDFSKGWLLGWMPKDEYFSSSRLLKKGDRDGDNGFIVKSDCYNLPINKLYDIEELV